MSRSKRRTFTAAAFSKDNGAIYSHFLNAILAINVEFNFRTVARKFNLKKAMGVHKWEINGPEALHGLCPIFAFFLAVPRLFDFKTYRYALTP